MKWQTRKARAGSDENNDEDREVIEGGFCIQNKKSKIFICATYFLNSINTFMISIILLYTTRIRIHRLGVGLFVLVCD